MRKIIIRLIICLLFVVFGISVLIHYVDDPDSMNVDSQSSKKPSSSATVGAMNQPIVVSEPMPATRQVEMQELTTGKIGLSGVPQNYQDTEENLLQVFSRAKQAGVQILSAGNARWNEEIEPAPGVYVWDAFDRYFAVARRPKMSF